MWVWIPEFFILPCILAGLLNENFSGNGMLFSENGQSELGFSPDDISGGNRSLVDDCFTRITISLFVASLVSGKDQEERGRR